MSKKRAFSDFSSAEIEEIANQASLRARQESLEAGLEVFTKDLSTNEVYAEKIDKHGNVVKRKVSREELIEEN